MEHARNVLGLARAEHAEYNADAELAFIIPASCAVQNAGRPRLHGRQAVRLAPGSRLHRIHGRDVVEEEFGCNFELDVRFRRALEEKGMRITGTDERGFARAAELDGHRFFVGTAYHPQLTPAHPLLRAFVAAARE